MNDVDFVFFVWLSVLTLAVLGSGIGTIQNVRLGFSAAARLVRAILAMIFRPKTDTPKPAEPAEQDEQ